MGRNVFLKSAVRKPLKSLIVFLLIGVISFGFMVKLVEYMVVTGETAKLEEYYKPVGRLRPESLENDLTAEGAELLKTDSSIDYLDINRGYTGVVDGIPAGDADNSIDLLKNISYFYGTVVSNPDFMEDKDYGYSALGSSGNYTYLSNVNVRIDKVVAGFEENMPVGEEVTIKYFSDFKPSVLPKKGEQYLWRAEITRHSIGYSGDTVLVFRAVGMGDGTYFYPVEDGEPQIANPDIAVDMKVRRESVYNSTMVTAKDMSRMPSFSDTFYVEDGRVLNRTDDINKNQVCVIHKTFAEKRGLDVGDKLQVKIHEGSNAIFSFNKTLEEAGLNNEDMASWGDSEWAQYNALAKNEPWIISEWQWDDGSVDVNLEIVGIYSAYDEKTGNIGYEERIYVPDSLVPAEWPSWINMNNFTFVLKSADCMDAFMKDTGAKLEDIGCIPEFEKNGWEDFKAAVGPLRQSVFTGVIVFALILAAVMGFGVIFFIYIHKSNWMMVRLLGKSKGSAACMLMVAAAATAVPAVVVGGLASWRYGLRQASETMAGLREMTMASEGISDASAKTAESVGEVSLPIYGLFIICFGIIILWILMMSVAVYMLGRRSLMQVMQGTAVKVKKADKPNLTDNLSEKLSTDTDSASIKAETSASRVSTAAEVSITVCTAQTAGRAGIGQALRYMSRHLVRTAGRGIMVVVVLAAFIFGLGWLQSAMKLNEEKIETLYNTVEMTGNIVPKQVGVSVYDKIGNIPKWAVTDLEETQRFSEICAQTEERVTLAAIDEKNQETGNYSYGGGNPSALVINHKNAYEPLKSGRIHIEFADGYDMSVFEAKKYEPEAKTAVIRKDILEMLGCSVGDRVKVIVSRSATFITNAESRSQIYTVVGSFTEDEPSEYEIILPSGAYENLVGTSGVYYTDVEFLADASQNRKIDEFKAEMKEILSDYSSEDYIQVDYILNESELTNAVEPLEKNNTLMRVLYPIVLAVAVLVTMLLCVLLTVQSYKETAIMRVLGTTKLRIGVILSVERLIVCSLGFCAGVIVSGLTLEGISENILITILGCAAICLVSGAAASIISAAVSVRRRPLEFLQVKE